MDLDFLANFANTSSEEELSYNKKDIMKILKRIGVDTRFVSYFEDENGIKLYVENFRFSKFSKKRITTFNNYYSDIEVIRSSLFQKICLRASKVLANSLNPKTKVLIPTIIDDYTKLLYIILEPYSRKYGIEFIEYDDNIDFNEINAIISPLTLNKQVNNILTDIFNGNGIIWDKKFKELANSYNNDEKIDYFTNKNINDNKYNIDNNDKNNKSIIFPLINVPDEWINDFLSIKTTYKIDYDSNDIATSFMGFLSEINPQFKENVLATSSFLENNQLNKK